LLFGFYRFCRWDGGGAQLPCLEEGIIYADDLPERDAAGFAHLSRYATAHDRDTQGVRSRALRLVSRYDFVNHDFYKAAYKPGRSMVVGFNLPFDLSRVAARASDAIGRNAGGFSFTLFQRRDPISGDLVDDPFRPRVIIQSQDAKRAFIRFWRMGKVDPDDTIPEGSTDGLPQKGYRFEGRFLDLKTLAFALTDKAYSLRKACEAFGAEIGKGETKQHGVITPEYIAYARRDVKATQSLLVKVRQEFDRHPVDLLPDRAYSPASLAKAYLRSMGITSLLERDA
jgi:hypothetical protein